MRTRFTLEMCTVREVTEYENSDKKKFIASGSGKHIFHVAEENYHLQLIRPYLNFTLQSTVNRVGGFPAQCASIIWNGFNSREPGTLFNIRSMLEPTAFLSHPEFAVIPVEAVVVNSHTTYSAWELT